MGRDADDFVILCQRTEDAQMALEEIHARIDVNGLILHPDKTHVGNCLREGQGFEFLGYRFEERKSTVRDKSLQWFKDKVREKTGRTRGDSVARIISDLTPMISGWLWLLQARLPLDVSPAG